VKCNGPVNQIRVIRVFQIIWSRMPYCLISYFTYGVVCAVTKRNKQVFVFVCVCGGGDVADACQHRLLYAPI
jgi:hypothetical protein